MQHTITDEQWRSFDEQGYLRLGQIIPADQIDGLRKRIDDIVLCRAKFVYDRAIMQLGSEDGTYGTLGSLTSDHKCEGLNYHKIESLEFDPLFLAYVQNPLFEDVCARVYGPGTPITVMRAMFMNKPANRGSWLPWHQGAWTMFDRAPRLTVWMALDPSTKTNGGVQIIPGSHKQGRINPSQNSGFLTDGQAQEHCPPKTSCTSKWK